jgi:hypothetical protein
MVPPLLTPAGSVGRAVVIDNRGGRQVVAPANAEARADDWRTQLLWLGCGRHQLPPPLSPISSRRVATEKWPE